MDTNFEIFKGKRFSDLCKDIYRNSDYKRNQIDLLVIELKNLIKTPSDAILIVPFIRDYLDTSVKNDDLLIKLAAVIQRFIAGNQVSDGMDSGDMLTEEEKRQLMGEVSQVLKESSKVSAEVKTLEEKSTEISK